MAVRKTDNIAKNIDRLVYIEPNELAAQIIKKEGLISNGRVDLDNITWNAEDLRYYVNLEVFNTNRGSLSVKEVNTKISDTGTWSSFLTGTKLDPKDKTNDTNYLTDAYTEINYCEYTNTGKSTKEALGINSIEINFDAHFFPLVTINFTDVRAAALFTPEEYNYMQEATAKAKGRKISNAERSFFKSLFHFPYPRFLLTVQGFYGDKVTFQLAVNDFKTAFNSTTGNFDVTVTFIGYMYGLYTDLPMSLVLTSPYYHTEFWNNMKENGNFTYDNGKPILNFIEYLQNYYTLNRDVEELRQYEEIVAYSNILKQKNALENIKDKYETFEDQFTNPVLNPKDETATSNLTTKEDNAREIVIETKQKSANLILTPQKYNNFEESVSEYNKNFSDSQLNIESLAKKQYAVADGKNIDWDITEYINNSPQIPTNNEEPYQIPGLPQIPIPNEVPVNVIPIPGNENKQSTTTFIKKTYTYNDGGIYATIIDKINTLDSQLASAKEEADEQMKVFINNKLGFIPTIENIYRMIFAHIETFMDSFYNLKKEIKRKSEYYRTPEYLGLTPDNSDLPSNYRPDTYIAPFPLCKKNKSKEVIYPGDAYENSNQELARIDEVDYINKIINGVEKFSSDFNDAVTNINTLNESVSSNYTPTILNDIFYNKNPYIILTDYLFNKNNNVTDDTAKANYIATYFYDRLSLFLLSICLYKKDNTNYRYDYEKIKENLEIFINTEFENFKSCNIKISSTALNALKTKDKILTIFKKVKRFNKINIPNYNDGIDLKEQIEYLYFPDPFNDDIVKEDSNIFLLNGDKTSIEDNFADKIPSELTLVKNGLNNNIYKKITEKPSNSPRERDEFTYSIVRKMGEIEEKKKIIKNNKEYELDTLGDLYSEGWNINDLLSKNIENFYAGFLQVGDVVNFSKDKPTIEHLYLGHYDGNKRSEPIMKGTNDYFEAFLLLGSLSSYYNLVNFRNFDIAENYNNIDLVKTMSRIEKMPKVVALYIGACVYFNENEDSFKNSYERIKKNTVLSTALANGEDTYYKQEILDNKVSLFTNSRFTFLGYVNIEEDKKQDAYKNDYRLRIEISKEEKDFFKNNFIRFVDSGEFGNINNILLNNNSKTIIKTNFKSDKGYTKRDTAIGYSWSYNSNEEIKIKEELKKIVYIFIKSHNPLVKYGGNQGTTTINTKNVGSQTVEYFAEQLAKKFNDIQVSEDNKQEEELKNSSPARAKVEQKKALYYTLKTLYDKWLCTYEREQFELKTPEEARQERRNRHSAGVRRVSHPNELCDNEFDSFVYVDSFYNDISAKLMTNPSVLCNLIRSYSAENVIKSNASVFEFMAEVAEKNSLLFISLPVYNNFYDVESIARIFMPNTKIGGYSTIDANNIGNTYVLMYTGEASSKLDYDDPNGYQGDGLYGDIAGTADSHIALDVFEKPKDINKEDDYTVPAFGVTYGMQNQMYFKNVTVNMDNPKVTDYSIANLIQISYGGAHSSNESYDVGIGQNIYSIYSNRSYTCTVEMMGCLNIMPMMYFQLNNIPMFRGFYIIISVSHSVVPGNVTTKFTGVRVSKNHIGLVKMPFDYQTLLEKMENSTFDIRSGKKIGMRVSTMKVDGKSIHDILSEEYEITSTTPTEEECNSKQVVVNLNEWFPGKSIKIHKKAAEEVKKIFKEIKEAGLTDLTAGWGGYNYRSAATNGEVLSNHSFGLAIDINPGVNQMNATGGEDNVSTGMMRTENHPIVKIFKKYGWGWGGSYKDWMHFSKLGGY